ncbi:hypothetical protein CONLIGDRAFT_275513 [Coniochaeta ligniaria NRRL 30616]|uniref:Uncharacterized protein n=1 Tax=Coniochaeta ligniaria NRRL 30616 TaxID=1408157 RepID=A0A1J7IY19_9PEZI|nr:hypothetical protein CONLIGDRAFT_275513 [Coniochaeta ligniaria NRRL 30616]
MADMGDALPPDEPYLSAYMRVQRGVETAQDLINAFPTLEQAALNSALTEHDHRRLLDFPDVQEEAANIRRVSTRPRAELLSAALSSPGELSDAELELLSSRFWADVTPQESHTRFNALADAEKTTRDRIGKAMEAVVEPGWFAHSEALRELLNRRQRREDEQTAARLGAHQRHTTPAWMDDLAQKFQEEYRTMNTWGYIAIYDAEAQESMNDEDRYYFERKFEDVCRDAMRENGAEATALARRWRLYFFDPPRRPSTPNTTNTTTPATVPSSSHNEAEAGYHTNILQWNEGTPTVKTPTSATGSSSSDEPEGGYRTTLPSIILQWNQDVGAANTAAAAAAAAISPSAPGYHTTLRSAFRAVLDSEECTNMLRWNLGVRTDVFLVVNKECIDSVVDNNFLDDMRVPVYEADFPQADDGSSSSYHPDGYEGWMWVRLEQLVYRFYANAFTRDDVEMRDIWRAAQASRHKAFVSLDPEVALGWGNSTHLTGQREGRYDVYF